MTERLSDGERARRRWLAARALKIGIPVAIVLFMVIVLLGVTFGLGPFAPHVVMDGLEAPDAAGEADGLQGKGSRTLLDEEKTKAE